MHALNSNTMLIQVTSQVKPWSYNITHLWSLDKEVDKATANHRVGHCVLYIVLYHGEDVITGLEEVC